MDVSCSYFYSQDKSSFVASCMRLIGKLPLMLSFYEHSAVRACGGDSLFYRFSAATLGMIFVTLIFNGLLTQLFSFLIDLSA